MANARAAAYCTSRPFDSATAAAASCFASEAFPNNASRSAAPASHAAAISFSVRALRGSHGLAGEVARLGQATKIRGRVSLEVQQDIFFFWFSRGPGNRLGHAIQIAVQESNFVKKDMQVEGIEILRAVLLPRWTAPRQCGLGGCNFWTRLLLLRPSSGASRQASRDSANALSYCPKLEIDLAQVVRRNIFARIGLLPKLHKLAGLFPVRR